MGYTIVGVMPREFQTANIDVWIPAQTPPFLMRIRDARFFWGVGRTKPGVSIRQAHDDLASVQRQLGEQFPQTDKGWSAVVRSLKEARVGEYRKTLLFVFGAVAMLLLIAVANIAGLMLTQLQQREREMAIRSSIGATRAQILGGVMREILLVSASGVVLGCAVAAWLVEAAGRTFTTLPVSGGLQMGWRPDQCLRRWLAWEQPCCAVCCQRSKPPARTCPPFWRRPGSGAARRKPSPVAANPGYRTGSANRAAAGVRRLDAPQLLQPRARGSRLRPQPDRYLPHGRCLGRKPYPRRSDAGSLGGPTGSHAGRGSRRVRQLSAGLRRHAALSGGDYGDGPHGGDRKNHHRGAQHQPGILEGDRRAHSSRDRLSPACRRSRRRLPRPW